MPAKHRRANRSSSETRSSLDEDEQTLLDLYETIAREPELYLDMQLEPGDVQWLTNHVILHARTAHEDHEEPERKRHLLRLWLSIGV